MKIILSSLSEMQFSLNGIQNEKALHRRKGTNQGFSLVIYQAMSQSTADIRYDPYDAANCKLCVRKFEGPCISE